MNKNLKKKLSEESKNFVPDIKDKVYRSVGYTKEVKPKKKLRLKPALAFMIILLLTLSIIIKPSAIANSFVIVEINPAIEIEVNKDNLVINSNPINSDGYFFLEKLDINNKTVDDALVEIVNQASADGYLTELGGTIYVSAANKNLKVENSLNNIIETTLEKHAPNHIKNDDSIKKEAKENNVSPGRMLIIKRAMEADNLLTLDDALKMEVNDLVAIMNNKAKNKIDKFEDEYKTNLERLKESKKNNLNELEKRIEAFEVKLEELEDLIDDEISKDQFEILVNEKFPEYDFDRNRFIDLDDYLEEIEDFYEDYYELLEYLIEDSFEIQKDIYKNKINENSNIGRDDFSFELDTTFSFDKFKGKYSDDEIEVIRIINQLNTFFKNDYPGAKGRINKLYNEYEDLIQEVSEEFKNSDIVIEFEENNRNYRNKNSNFNNKQ